MTEEIKTKTAKRKNAVHIVGYLKENTLESMKDKNGNEIIRGALTIATDEISSYRVSFYSRKLRKDGTESKDYTRLSGLLPKNTTTIANYLNATPTANFATAANMSTKVWVRASLEEYVYMKDDKQRSMVTLRGASADFKTIKDGAFTPHAQFEADIYVEKINPEMKRETPEDSPEETGRIIITGLVPNWDGNMFRIEFVAPETDGIAEHIKDNYQATGTATIRGDLKVVSQEAPKTNVSNENWFGKPREKTYTTTFRRERVINGGSATTIPAGEPGSITQDEVRDGLATREAKIAAAKERSAKSAGAKVNAEEKLLNATSGNSLEDFDF